MVNFWPSKEAGPLMPCVCSRGLLPAEGCGPLHRLRPVLVPRLRDRHLQVLHLRRLSRQQQPLQLEGGVRGEVCHSRENRYASVVCFLVTDEHVGDSLVLISADTNINWRCAVWHVPNDWPSFSSPPFHYDVPYIYSPIFWHEILNWELIWSLFLSGFKIALGVGSCH